MKINELMIGDFVTFKDCQEDKIPFGVKIIALGHQDRGEENAALVSIDGAKICDIIEIDDEIVGIPISSKILEKNGFKKEGSWFVIEDDYYDVSIREITDSIWRVKYRNREFFAFDCVLHIAFIHDLQHALRFCGISKEIVL